MKTLADFECIWDKRDIMNVLAIGHFFHFSICGNDVVLTTEEACRLVGVLREELGAADMRTPTEARADAEAEASRMDPSVLDPEPDPVMEPMKVPTFTGLSPQAQTVYQHMTRAGSISALDAMNVHGITSATLARRICDIEAEGFLVKRDRRVHPITNKQYTRYTLRQG